MKMILIAVWMLAVSAMAQTTSAPVKLTPQQSYAMQQIVGLEARQKPFNDAANRLRNERDKISRMARAKSQANQSAKGEDEQMKQLEKSMKSNYDRIAQIEVQIIALENKHDIKRPSAQKPKKK